MEGDRKRAFESGFDLHLPKPVDTEQLVSAIQKVLKRSGVWSPEAGD
jgi:CheY-like chemotaxis protein